MKTLTSLCVLWLVPMVGWAQELTDTERAIQQQELSELLWNVQDQIEADPALGGMIVTGGNLIPRTDPPGEVLELYGRITTPEQKPVVVQIVQDTLARDPYWQNRPVEVNADAMGIAMGSVPLGTRYYELGLEYFWNGQPVKADQAFARAVAEIPNDDVFRYWRVVTALALGQEDRARAKLAPLLATYPYGSRTPIIATAFERLQGPLRFRLMELEKEVLLSL